MTLYEYSIRPIGHNQIFCCASQLRLTDFGKTNVNIFASLSPFQKHPFGFYFIQLFIHILLFGFFELSNCYC